MPSAVVLNTPVAVGTLASQTTVSQLQLVAIAVNYEPSHIAKGCAVVSLKVRDMATGYVHSIQYRDAQALALALQMDAMAASPLLSRALSGGQLPPGQIVPVATLGLTGAAANGSVVLTASAFSGSSALTSGSVTFSDGASVLGTAQLGAAGTATLSVSSLAPGAHAFTASLASTSTVLGATSPVVNFTVI